MKLSIILLAIVTAGGVFSGAIMGLQLGYIIAAASGIATLGCIGILIKNQGQVKAPSIQGEPAKEVDDQQSISKAPKSTPIDAELNAGINSEQTDDIDSLLVFDMQHILDSMDNDYESVGMLLEIFLEEHADDGEKLKRALDTGDLSKVQLIAHSLKGVAGSLGAQQLRAVTEHIEHSARQGGQITHEDCLQLNVIIAKVELEIAAGLELCQSEAMSDTTGLDKNEDVVIEELTEQETPVFVSEPPQPTIEDVPQIKADQPVSDTNARQAPAKIDVNFLLDSLDGDQETALMLLDIFIEEHASDGHSFVNMVKQSEIDEQSLRLVHSLKGVSGSLGATVLNSVATDIETKLKQQQTVTLDESIRLDQVLTETVTSAKEYLSEATVA
ncbi:Hpt domain-containing protein [Photobacterium minamisatsumaniensis]|uniref:Hpt domain-containing protein n=1 Tax=Photobacterium minamisatsumaniensis TaxID=2910233 RepID=UPI003D145CA5